MENLVKKQRST